MLHSQSVGSMLVILGLLACSSSEKKLAEPTAQETKVSSAALEKPELATAEPSETSTQPKDSVPATSSTAVTEQPHPIESKTEPHWGYKGAFGPQFWSSLHTSFELCKAGKEQSPIDLVWKKPLASGSVAVADYAATGVRLIARAQNLMFEVAAGSKLNYNGKDYALKDFVFHNPSEHSLSGRNFPLELQLRHQAESGEILQLAVFFQEGESNALIQKLWDAIPREKNQAVSIEPLGASLAALLPTSTTHYVYRGSLTQPPCTEAVTWLVFNSPLTASKAQIEAFKALYQDNVRPVQALGERKYFNY